MTPRKSNHHKAAAVLGMMCLVLCIGFLLAGHSTVTEMHSSALQPLHLRRLSVPDAEAGVAAPPNATEDLQDVAAATRGRSAFDPRGHAYLIIHYHKTGHHLSRALRDFLVAGAGDGAGPVSNGRENTFQFRMHEEATGCPRALDLRQGVVHVQAAPDLFCDTNLLAEDLLRTTDPGAGEKKGVKVVHLVRDPFDLAVSNWVYHAQWPTPEAWVKSVDPCADEAWFERQSLADLVGGTLLLGDDPVMRYDDFAALHRLCTDLYQASEESRDWTFYNHLRHLDPPAALALATTHMMVQGRSGGDILRMASNMVKLRQVQRLEDHIRISQHRVPPARHERLLQVMTLSMEEFTQRPKATTLRFLDFALEDAVTPKTKQRIAGKYARAYLDKVKKGDAHITNDKEIRNGAKKNIGQMKGELERYLRTHPLFGRVLGNIERLVNDCLRDSGSAIPSES